MSYSSDGNRPKRAKKGPLMPDNWVVAFAKTLSRDNDFSLEFRKTKRSAASHLPESPGSYALRSTITFWPFSCNHG